MNKLLLIAFTLLLSACGAASQNDSAAAAMSTKPIFSQWYLADGSVLDLRGLDFGLRTSIVPVRLYGTTYSCQTTISATGDQNAGVVDVQSSVAIGLASGAYTTACGDLLGTYTYERNAIGMIIGRSLSAPLQYR